MLYQQLRKQGADAHVVKLPDGPWNGPDDYLAAAGDPALAGLFQEAEQEHHLTHHVQQISLALAKATETIGPKPFGAHKQISRSS